MKTAIAKGHRKSKDANAESSLGSQAAGGPVVAMIGCFVALFLMLAV